MVAKRLKSLHKLRQSRYKRKKKYIHLKEMGSYVSMKNLLVFLTGMLFASQKNCKIIEYKAQVRWLRNSNIALGGCYIFITRSS